MQSSLHKTTARMIGSTLKPIGQDSIRKLDCYSTPEIAITELLKREQFSDFIWEPANGEGWLSRIVKKHGYEVFASDIKRWDKTTEIQRDFHAFTRTPYGEDCDIITNPPFRDSIRFVETAMQLLQPKAKLALILPVRYFSGKTRKKKVFLKYPPVIVYIFSYRIPRMHQFFYKGPQSSGMIDFAWFVWEKGYTGNTVVKWI